MNGVGAKLWNILDSVMRFVVYRVFQLKISEQSWSKFQQFVKFGIVGVSNTAVSYIVYVIMLTALESRRLFPNVDYLIAQFASFFVGTLWSFYWNRKYVFDAETEAVPWFQALLKVYATYAFTGIFLSSALSWIWVQWLHIPKLIAPIINLFVSVPVNFLLNKFWAFRGKEKKG